MSASPSFFHRLTLAFSAPLRLLFDAGFAGRVVSAGSDTPQLEAPRPEPELETTAPVQQERDTSAALQLIAVLQREGRFLDFLSESVDGFDDAEIGAAARVVHAGCRKVLDDYFEILPIRDEEEGSDVELAEGYDAARNRVTGKVVGQPPYRGKLAHHGWAVREVRLPELSSGHDPSVLAPAEVEL